MAIDSVALVLMHAWKYPDHEQQVAALVREMGFHQVSVSHEVSPLVKLIGRGDTTVVDAYLSPILRRYVEQVAEELGIAPSVAAQSSKRMPADGVDRRLLQAKLMFMMSSGGLTAAELFQGKDAILSGPAGGVVGAVETSRLAGFDRMIGFDMGGTSTDVSHYDGELERAFETEVAGVRMRAPMMRIHTVAAGGGSILHFQGWTLSGRPGFCRCQSRTGMLSARWTARCHRCQCHGRKTACRNFSRPFSDPTRTSLWMPMSFSEKFAELAGEIGSTPEEVADGFLKIAVENMANAIKKISVQRGYDVTEYALNCFGGAGGQHACAVADTLGMETVLIHPFSGILSAYGMGLAKIRANRTRALVETLDKPLKQNFNKLNQNLRQKPAAELQGSGRKRFNHKHFFPCPYSL